MTAICLLYITRYGTIRRYVCTTASSSFVSFGSLLWSCHELQQQYIIRTLTELQVRCWWSMTMTPAACIHGARSAPIHNMYMMCPAYEHHQPVVQQQQCVQHALYAHGRTPRLFKKKRKKQGVIERTPRYKKRPKLFIEPPQDCCLTCPRPACNSSWSSAFLCDILPLSATERNCNHHQRSDHEPCITLASRRACGAMVSTRQRASKAAAALGLAAGASLCSNHGVGAFYSPLAFAPRQISRVTRSAEGVQPTVPFSTAGRGRRFYVRERAGSEVQLGLGSRRDSVMGRARGLGEGSRKGSRLWMLADEDAASVSVGVHRTWLERGSSHIARGGVEFHGCESWPSSPELRLAFQLYTSTQLVIYLLYTRLSTLNSGYVVVCNIPGACSTTGSRNQSSSFPWWWRGLCLHFLF